MDEGEGALGASDSLGIHKIIQAETLRLPEEISRGRDRKKKYLGGRVYRTWGPWICKDVIGD